MKLGIAWPYIHMSETRKNSLNISMITNRKSTCQHFLQRWYLGLLIMWLIQRNQPFPLALSQKKEKLYRQVVIMLTTLMTKATTTLCNYFFTIKNYSLLLYNVAVVWLAPRITTEVDHEPLFNQSEHLSKHTCSRTKIKTLELLLITKH